MPVYLNGSKTEGSRFVHTLRRALWEEHLGLPHTVLSRTAVPPTSPSLFVGETECPGGESYCLSAALADPVASVVYNGIWRAAAEHNTEVFDHVFLSIPKNHHKKISTVIAAKRAEDQIFYLLDPDASNGDSNQHKLQTFKSLQRRVRPTISLAKDHPAWHILSSLSRSKRGDVVVRSSVDKPLNDVTPAARTAIASFNSRLRSLTNTEEIKTRSSSSSFPWLRRESRGSLSSLISIDRHVSDPGFATTHTQKRMNSTASEGSTVATASIGAAEAKPEPEIMPEPEADTEPQQLVEDVITSEALEEARENWLQWQAASLSQVTGHLVNYPKHYLEHESLSVPVNSLEYLLPSYLFR